ncbi:MAG: hypothetical protein WC712_05515 [Candidatus Brocadiia bacterium]
MFETREGMWAWLLQRVTAVYIAFALIVHFYLQHFTFKAGNEEISGARFFTADQISGRLAGNWWWAVFYLLFLFCLSYHAFAGVVKVIEDHNTSPGFVKWLNALMWVGIFATLAAGIVVYYSLTNVSWFSWQ